MSNSRTAATFVFLSGAWTVLAGAAELPTPCAAGACGPGPAAWIASGNATAVQSGNTLTVNQTTDKAVLNWKNFNISADGSVNFTQPQTTSVALNRIFQNDAVKILGSLSANGIVYLINQNGIVFGQGAKVNVGGLVASSLDITPDAVDGLLNAAKAGTPAFRSFTDADGNPLASGNVQVESGAELSAEKGQIMLFGPEVHNAGSVTANGGQVIFAAGDSIFLAPGDENLRGLFVEVGQGGTVTNAGQIRIERGNVTLTGLMVNQNGRISATTSVRENGSIRLIARDGGSVTPSGGLSSTRNGSLNLGAGSQTEIELDLASTDKAVDATPQVRSSVLLEGKEVRLENGSAIVAPAGKVDIFARANSNVAPSEFSPEPGDGHLTIESNATIDVSGASIEKTMESNVLRVELRGSQLADSPTQRNGALRGQTAFIDIRQTGTRADGTTWQGSPIGDLSGDIATIQKTVGERSLAGGTISLAADGSVDLQSQSVLNVSGGKINYDAGYVKTSQLLGANGQLIDISRADRDATYTDIVNNYTVDHAKWGVTETFTGYFAGQFEAGYVEGKDAGQVNIVAPRSSLDGSIRADVTAGRYQRKNPGDFSSSLLYRPFDQLPLAGGLTIGSVLGELISGNPNYVMGDVVFSGDPLADANALRLRPDLFGDGKVGRLAVYSNGRISLPENTSIEMPAAGSIALTGGSIDIAGTLSAPAGSVAVSAAPTATTLLASGDSRLTLERSATIDVSGRWVNDLPLGSSVVTTGPLIINGGSVSLTSRNGSALELQTGSLIDVSAGAQRTAAGQINGGKGGSISITAGPGPAATASEAQINSDLRGYALVQGGKLTITANAVCVADFDCSSLDEGRVQLDPMRFAAAGFSQITFGSNLGGIEIAPGTLIRPRQVNFLLDAAPAALSSGAHLADFARIGTLLDQQRLPVSLAFNARPLALQDQPFSPANFDDVGIISIGHGAVIDLDPLASLSFTSTSSIVVDGRLSAPAGSIALNVIAASTAPTDFLSNQGIWLQSGAQLLATGTARVLTDDLGMRSGDVLQGGKVSLQALHGYIVTAQDALIDVSGSATDLNIGRLSTNGAPLTRIASAGGSIEFTAAEGMLLNGKLAAHAGDGPGAAGGTLKITVDGNLRDLEPPGIAPIYPLASREIRIGDIAPIVVAPQSTVPLQYNGVAFLSADRISDGGFNSLEFSALNLFDAANPTGLPVPAYISFVSDTHLAVPFSIRLNAPRITATPGSAIELSASYIGLGYDKFQRDLQAGGDSAPGTAQFTAQANLIDVIGTLGLDGFDSTALRSRGDIRFRGEQLPPSLGPPEPVAGVLRARGSLILEAQQLYPTTMSQYRVLMEGDGDDIDDRLSIIAAPGAGGVVLSAGGSLELVADEISQAGVLRAPFGHLSLTADRLNFSSSSVTSTSGAGAIIPFGTIEAGADWVYRLPRGQDAVFTQSGPPDQQIVLQARQIDIGSGATLDLSGGGQLQAYVGSPGTELEFAL